MKIESRTLLQNVSGLIALAGSTLDVVNKASRHGIFNPHPLGEGSLLEQHIGNFTSSSFFGYLGYYHLTREFELSPATAGVIAVLGVVAINLLAEAVLVSSDGTNIQFIGDVISGTVSGISTVCYLASCDVAMAKSRKR